MADLLPTPTRLELLQDVASGEVWQHEDGQSVVGLAGTTGRTGVVRCTAAIASLQRAGWVEVVALKYGRRWQLTDKGRAVLDAGAVS